MTAVSPASSPRLPSPPPIAEDQVGPMSPSAASFEEQGKLGLAGSVDHNASRRIRPGTKSADMAEGPPRIDLKDIDSAFQLTEYLKAEYCSLTHEKDAIVPIDQPTALRLSQPPEGVDRYLWLYELCRFLTQKINSIVIALFADEPSCSSQTCPEMRASEWQYLCAVHDPPKSCCAIDYCCHTLDWAANTLTSTKHFPSRLALGTETNSQAQIRQLTNIFRRVYRIFAHAWFQHRDIFWKVETRTGLYVFFKTVCDEYNLIDKDNYTIPQEAEGADATPVSPKMKPIIIKKEEPDRRESMIETSDSSASDNNNNNLSAANTTKRHRSTPSLSQMPVTTVVEEVEEDEEPAEKESVPRVEVLESKDDGPASESKAADKSEADDSADEESSGTEDKEKEDSEEEDQSKDSEDSEDEGDESKPKTPEEDEDDEEDEEEEKDEEMVVVKSSDSADSKEETTASATDSKAKEEEEDDDDDEDDDDEEEEAPKKAD